MRTDPPRVWDWYDYPSRKPLGGADDRRVFAVRVKQRPPEPGSSAPWRLTASMNPNAPAHPDPAADRNVVLKLLAVSPEVLTAENAQELTADAERECEALARLAGCSGVVQVYAAGLGRDVGGEPVFFIAMEYVNGRNLGEVIELALLTTGWVEVRQVALWGKELAEALARAHEKGVIHRDLKPSNVLITGDGGVKVCDFGLAKFLPAGRRAVTVSDTGLGTEGYMAPEQVSRRGRVGPRTDVYGAGAVMYACVSGGTAPFAGRSAVVTLQVRDDAPTLPSRARRPRNPSPAPATDPTPAPQPPEPDPGLAALEHAIEVCLRKWPRLRFRSMNSLAAALGRVATGEYVPRRSDRVVRCLDWGYRRWAVVLPVFLVLLLLSLVPPLLVYLRSQVLLNEAETERAAQADRARIAEAGRATAAESASRSARLAKVRLLQDAALDRQRTGDDGTGAVLLALALQEAAGLEPALVDPIRVALTVARSRLLPLRNVLELPAETQARTCAISHDGRLAIVGTDTGDVWYVDPDTGRPRVMPPGRDRYHIGTDKTRDAVTAVAFAPTGLRFAAATAGGTIHVIDPSGAAPPVLIDHPGNPTSVGFHPDGRRVVVAGRAGRPLSVRDAALAAVVGVPALPPPVEVAVYDLDRPRHPDRVLRLGYEVYAAAISPDGKWLAVGGGIPPNPRLAAWDLTRRDPAPARNLKGQPARVFTLAFRPGSGARLATGDVNGTVRFWDLGRDAGGEADGPEIEHERQVRLTAFSPDGRLLLVGGESGTARLWDVETRTQMGQPLEHRDQVRAGAVWSGGGGAPPAGRAITADFAGDVRTWDLRPPSPPGWTFHHPSPVWDAAFRADGRKVLTGFASSPTGGGGALVWDLADGSVVALPHGADVMAAKFRPGRPDEVATCGNDGTVVFWDTRPGWWPVGRPLGRPLKYGGELVYAAGFDPTGDRFAFAGLGTGKIEVYDFDRAAAAWRRFRAVTHQKNYTYIWGVRFGADANRLFTEAGEAVRVWDLARPGEEPWRSLALPGVEKKTGRTEVLLAATDRTPGRDRVLTRWTDGRAAVWDLAEADPKPQFLGDRPHGRGRGAADWSPDGTSIATGGADGTVALWRPSAGGRAWERVPPAGGGDGALRHPSPVKLLAFSPDGRWVATACQDGGLRLWSVPGGQWSGAGWHHDGPITRLAFSPDGRHVLTASRDRTARVVPIPGRTLGEPGAVVAHVEADAGVGVTFVGTGATASATPPRPLTAAEFRTRRDDHPAPATEEPAATAGRPPG